MAISLVNSNQSSASSGTSVTVTAPSGCTDDDLMIAAVMNSASSSTVPGAFTWPSGWTAIDSVSHSDTRSSLVEFRYRFFVAGDTTWTVTLAAANAGYAEICSAYRGVNKGGAAVTDVFQDHQSKTSDAGGSAAAITTTSVSTTDSGQWRVSAFIIVENTTTNGLPVWGTYTASPSSPAGTERQQASPGNLNNSPVLALVDSDGGVAVGATTQTATPSKLGYSKSSWVGLLNVLYPTNPALQVSYSAIHRASRW